MAPGPDVNRGRMEQLLHIEGHFCPFESVYRSVSRDITDAHEYAFFC